MNTSKPSAAAVKRTQGRSKGASSAEILRNVVMSMETASILRYVDPGQVDPADLAAAVKQGKQHLAEANAALDRLAAGKNIAAVGDGRRVLGKDGKSYPVRPDPELPDRVQQLRAGGLSIRGIADRLGCSVGTVHRMVSP